MSQPMFLLVLIACAVLFFRAAHHERMNPWVWSVSSMGLTGIVAMRGGSIAVILVVQVVLFVLMWWYNMRRQKERSK